MSGMKRKIHYRVGLERESLRMSQDGNKISDRDHPDIFGDPLTNKFITMDFAESQLELATPVFTSIKKALDWVDMTMAYIMQKMRGETLWPMSTPPPFDDHVKIASFGNSVKGQRKHLYRQGLKHRFGLEKQLLSGYHFNFSLTDCFFEDYKQIKESSLNLHLFKTESYLHMMRNFYRFGWIINYFCGSSVTPFQSMDQEAFKHATSIRQSRYGYTNKIQENIALDLNLFSLYTEEIRALCEATCPAYKHIGENQLSSSVLQIPNELYTIIRPKRVPYGKESELDALERDGIEYLEVRLLDINPLYRTGTSEEILTFIKEILIFCLFEPSDPMSADEYIQCKENHFLVAEKGLDNSQMLSINGKNKTIKDWINYILTKADLKAPEVMPIKVRQWLGNDPLTAASNQAKLFANQWRKCGCSFIVQQEIEREITISQVKQYIRDTSRELPIEPIKEMEYSTQVLIRDAIENDIDVQILDRTDHFIKLKNNGKKEIIHKATCTSKDPFVNILMKGNKAITKKVLEEHGINTPKGRVYDTKKTTLEDRLHFTSPKLVIKPNATNMGVSINFVDRDDIVSFEKSVDDAFSHGKQILVEEFITGKEYRFLVINFEVIAIAHRAPAQIIGNNIDTVEELIRKKNETKYAKAQIKGDLDPKLLKRILKDQEKLILHEQSNVSTGGDAIDMTDKVDKSYSIIAKRAAKALGSRICGVDMIIKDEKELANQENYSIIELNYNPMLSIHTHPDQGKQRDVTTPIFRLLGLL